MFCIESQFVVCFPQRPVSLTALGDVRNQQQHARRLVPIIMPGSARGAHVDVRAILALASRLQPNLTFRPLQISLCVGAVAAPPSVLR